MALAFPQLGEHCKICNTLDFLPFKCAHCKGNFCKKHRTTEDHKCTQVTGDTTISCPICDKKLKLDQGDCPDTVVNAHISRGCPAPQSTGTKVPAGRCAKCNKKELLPATCTRCHQHYCVKHRFYDAHGCASSTIRVC